MENKHQESEKLTLNVGFVDLGRFDVMASEGFYANRSDFIRTATRNQLASHAGTVEQTVQRNTMHMMVVRELTRSELESAARANHKLVIKVVGLDRTTDDVDPELAMAAIESIEVLGALQASQLVKRALADRIT